MSTAVFKPIQPHQPLRASFAEKRFRIDRVRRALFEPIDHAETQKFLERELAKHTINDCNKWEFDFRNEVPLSPKGSRGRFVWKAARQSEETITYAPKRQRVLDDTDNSDLYPTHLEEISQIKQNAELRSDENKNAIITTDVTSQDLSEGVCKLAKQSKITDFMQSRKRTAESAFSKKLTNTTTGERPIKIPRECS